MNGNKINVAVVGATGYVGLDLVFLLSLHPKVKILNLCATKNIGSKISGFDKRLRKKLPIISNVNKVEWNKIDLIFLSLPNGEGQKLIKKLFYKYKHLKFIDLSADFRITNPENYKRWYKRKHLAKDLIRYSIYSISEFVQKKIQNYRIIANPGCYPTSIQIPLVPLLQKRLIKKDDIIIDSKSGYSGAGKKYKLRFTHKNLDSSIFSYSVKEHRHMAEIDQEIKKRVGNNIKYTFNPHLIPTYRGITSNIYIKLSKGITAKKILYFIKEKYKTSKFVKVNTLNKEIGSGNVLNSNKCEISICETRHKDKAMIISCIDNLIKGASGQAIQNMNLIYNYRENEGLK